MTFTVDVCHKARSLYALTAGIVQSFVRNKGFPGLSYFLQPCKWLDVDLTFGSPVSPLPNCV